MSRLARRAVIATKGGSAKVYSDFVAHITTLSAGASVGWGSSSGSSGAGSRTTTAAVATGLMFGTSWNSNFWIASTTCRVVQHGLPSEAEFNSQIASLRMMLLTTVDAGNGLPVGITRNGFTSSSDNTEPYPFYRCTQLLYWSGTDTGGSAFQMNPSTGTGPTPYTW